MCWSFFLCISLCNYLSILQYISFFDLFFFGHLFNVPYPGPSFLFIRGPFQATPAVYNLKNTYSVYVARIRTHNLQNMSLISLPLDQASLHIFSPLYVSRISEWMTSCGRLSQDFTTKRSLLSHL